MDYERLFKEELKIAYCKDDLRKACIGFALVIVLSVVLVIAFPRKESVLLSVVCLAVSVYAIAYKIKALRNAKKAFESHCTRIAEEYLDGKNARIHAWGHMSHAVGCRSFVIGEGRAFSKNED